MDQPRANLTRTTPTGDVTNRVGVRQPTFETEHQPKEETAAILHELLMAAADATCLQLAAEPRLTTHTYYGPNSSRKGNL